MKILRAAVVVSLALVVGGCSADEPKPSTLPPAPPASSLASDGALPVDAQQATPVAASNFIRHFLEVVNEGFASGDATQVLALSAPTCGTCRSFAAAIDSPSDPEERIAGGQFTVTDVATTLLPDGAASSLVTYTVSEVRVSRPNGDLISSTPEQPPVTASVSLQRGANSWLVDKFNVAP